MGADRQKVQTKQVLTQHLISFSRSAQLDHSTCGGRGREGRQAGRQGGRQGGRGGGRREDKQGGAPRRRLSDPPASHVTHGFLLISIALSIVRPPMAGCYEAHPSESTPAETPMKLSKPPSSSREKHHQIPPPQACRSWSVGD